MAAPSSLQLLEEEDLAHDDQTEDAKTGVEIVALATTGGPIILPARDRISIIPLYTFKGP
jgi:hypothetical protein